MGIIDKLAAWQNTSHEGDPIVDCLLDDIAAAKAEIERLQKILDSRPAINAALPSSYIHWSQSIYVMEVAHVRDTTQ